ncbi:ABC transporter substrate-binding protein [Ideonella sp.]|jgi:ABC-type branched-subunit amino acid transport system substrate-binding protein|uniref:ABC transporter substrate-binding protein n=1 Tax=Ideonella sp. TaxID=1929293 RepID=UPI0037C15F03
MSCNVPRRAALQRLAALSAAATTSLPSFAQRDGRLILGQSAAFSGPAAQLGLQLNRGARLCFDQVNASGGVNGATIELRTLDDGYEPGRCKANTEKFINDNVFALFGYVGTPTGMAALPLINDARIPFFGPFTGAMGLREPFSRNVFHLRASYDDETGLIVKQLTALGLNKIAVFRQNDSYGQAGLDGVTKALKAQRLEPVAIGTVERNSTDVAAAVKTIVPARPDAVVQISAYKSCAAFVREARKAGYGGTFFNVSFVGTQALADELGREARGVLVSQVVPYPYTQSMQITRDYLDAVKAAGADAKPNYSSMEGYLAARVFVEGLRRSRTLSRDGLISGLESMTNVNFGGFQVNFSRTNHVASRFVEVSMLTEDGGVRR